MGFKVMIGAEYEFFNFAETPQSWAAKKGPRTPRPITDGMFGYSILRAGQNRGYFNALMDDMAKFGIPSRACTRRRARRVRGGDPLLAALEAGDRAFLFKTAAKEVGQRFGIMPSFMAKWNPKYPGCSGHVHQSLSDGKKNLFHDPNGRYGGMSKLFESYLAGTGRPHDGIRADVLADGELVQAPRRRLLGAGEADVGRGQSHGLLPRAARARRKRRASRRAARAPT
jgi:glutamine synthetase